MPETSQDLCNVLVVQRTASPINFVQIIRAPMRLECWLETCWWLERLSKYLSVNKNSQFFNNIFVHNLNIQNDQRHGCNFIETAFKGTNNLFCSRCRFYFCKSNCKRFSYHLVCTTAKYKMN